MVSFCSGYAHANGWVEERYAEVPYFDAAVAGDAAKDRRRGRTPRRVVHHLHQLINQSINCIDMHRYASHSFSEIIEAKEG